MSTREFYVDPSVFLLCASPGKDSELVRQNLDQNLKQGAHFFTSVLTFIQWDFIAAEAGLDQQLALSISDGFADLCSEILPFDGGHWQKARALRMENSISIQLAGHAAAALEAGLMWICSTSKQYRKVPGLIVVDSNFNRP